MELRADLKGVAYVCGIGAVLFSLTVFSLVWARHTEFLQENPFTAQSGVELSFRIIIPKINVGASVISVGRTPEGLMDAPLVPHVTAWFNEGPHPGKEGSAVINGHSGWKDNIPAVFDDVHMLEYGDSIFIEDENGARVVFIVQEIRTFDPQADTFEVFNSEDGKAHLNLITCAGVWDETAQSFSERIVVFAEREDSEFNESI